MKPEIKGYVNGNAFAIIAAVSKALKLADQGDKVEEYRQKAVAGSYDNLLRVSSEYADFRLEPEDEEDEEDILDNYEEEDED